MKEQFIKFLRRNGITRKFKKNLVKMSFNDWLELNMEEPGRFITGAFHFDDTSEKHDYWWDFHVKWLKKVREDYGH